jgi:hypothetical protein
MQLDEAMERVLLGESIRSIAVDHRANLLASVHLDPREALPETFAAETSSFTKALCRALGERHAGDPRALAALREWVRVVDDYEAWDALLTHFDFAGKEQLVRRGRTMFAGPLTAHWRTGASAEGE